MANPGLLLKGAKMLAKTPAGKRAKKKIVDGVKQRVNPNKYKTGTTTDQFSIANSTVRDRLTKAMRTLPFMSTTEAAKASAVSATVGYLLGKNKKK